MRNAPVRRVCGFTLVEMIVTITLIGLLAVAAVPLLQLPMRAYQDAMRRAEVAGELDVTAAKLRDDLTQALPGSVRVDPTGRTLEYLRVRTMGRYRDGSAPTAICAGGAANDVLQVGAPDTQFATLGAMTGLVAGGDYVVLNPTAGNVYLNGAGSNSLRSRLMSSTPSVSAPATASCLQITANTFTSAPGNKLFYVVAEPVSYVCAPAQGTLTRFWGYAIAAAQPVAFAAAVPSAPLARRVSDCRFAVTSAGASSQVVSAWVRLNTPSSDVGAFEPADIQLTLAVRETP